MSINVENAQSIGNKATVIAVGSGGASTFLTDNMQLFSLGVAVLSVIVSIIYYTAKIIETKRYNNLKLKREKLDRTLEQGDP